MLLCWGKSRTLLLHGEEHNWDSFWMGEEALQCFYPPVLVPAQRTTSEQHRDQINASYLAHKDPDLQILSISSPPHLQKSSAAPKAQL